MGGLLEPHRRAALAWERMVRHRFPRGPPPSPPTSQGSPPPSPAVANLSTREVVGGINSSSWLSAWRVALLLRGQAFRGSPLDKRHYSHDFVTSCNASYSRIQEHAWSTLLEHVVLPLEEDGGTVDIVATECTNAEGCEIAEESLGRIFGSRMLGVKTNCTAANQGESMRATLTEFRSRALVPILEYDLVLVTRHDLIWSRNITLWGADFSRLNFLARCMMRCGEESSADVTPDRGACHPILGGSSEECVLDALHTLPGHTFSTFEKRIIGSDGCFSLVDDFDPRNSDPRKPHTPSTAGHLCYNASAAFLPETPGFILNDWRPKHVTRELNPICSFVRLHDSYKAA